MKKVLLIFCCFCLFALGADAQLRGLQNRVGNTGAGQQSQGKSDSLIIPEKRPVIHIDIHYRHLDDVVDHKLDSSINDFTKYIPLPADYIDLGNLGTAAHSLIYTPIMNPGFDAGFHAFDVYRFTLDSTKFYNTTRPYSLLRYMIGSKQEQLIEVLFTQNPRPNFNFGFHLRKINAPGFFQNENTDDNSYNVFAHYNTKNKRYNAYISFVGNKIHAGENGGITNDSSLSQPLYTDRRTVPVNLGGASAFSIGFFAAPVATKSDFIESSWLFNQRYDWGHGDTVKVNDTTFNYEFHPSFRIENTLKLSNQEADYTDTIPSSASLYYFKNYGIDSLWKTRLSAASDWKTFSNDFSLVKFPSQKNAAHFIKAGATFEYLKGNFLQNSISFYNVKGHFEYHNLTRNEKWDLDAKGVFYFLGNNFGDYLATASLSRYLNEKLGNITLSFSNLNKTPAFNYQFFPTNYFISTNGNLKKTNITQLQFQADNAHLKYTLQVNYFVLTNYTYFKNFSESAQDNSVFNLWQIVLNKQFTAGHFNWYLDLALQQTIGNSPLHVPRIWTRNRFAYEGIFYKNMLYTAGIEAVYNTPYYQDNYSPVLQQFVNQEATKINNTLPNTAVFLDFRIKAFVAYVRAENLNTFVQPNQMQIAHYPYPGFTIRVGFQWSYVN
jgi:hypothetical protein